jgi:subtilisin
MSDRPATPDGPTGGGEVLRPAWTRDSMAVQLPGITSLDQITPAWAWGGATGAGVRIAVIDSGIDADHPWLDGCVDVEGGVAIARVEGEVTEEPGPHDDLFGHGTACAGIIHSFAPRAAITSVRVLGPRLSGTSEVFLRGLAWAVERGFDVVNLSLGTRRRDWALAFYEVCDHAYFTGSFVVTAANNIMRPSFPSLYSSVTSVACNLSADPWRFHYNPDPPTEFLARGVDVEVAWKDGSTMRSTGNSYAAPHIAGLAALILSKHPELRPFQLKAVLAATAVNVRDEPSIAGRITRATRATVVGRGTRASRALHPVDPLPSEPARGR